MSNEVVLYDKKDSGVALISLNRPDRLNAITCLLYTSPSPRDQ